MLFFVGAILDMAKLYAFMTLNKKSRSNSNKWDCIKFSWWNYLAVNEHTIDKS